MGGHLPGRRDAARLCRADRHQRQHHDPRQGDPPRVPARRGRSVQQRPGHAARATASSRSASSRTIWRSSRSRARRPTASCSASRSRSGRPASCSSRPASRASSASWSTSRSGSATSWAAARSCAPRSIIRAIPSRSSSASPSPICSTATSRSASTSSGAIYNNFNFIGNERTTTYEQVTTGGQIRAGRAADRTAARSRCATASTMTRSGSTRPSIFTDPDGAGPLPAACDPLLAGRYLCDAIGNRLTSSIGYSLVYDTLNNRLRPSRGERIVLSQDFAGLGGDVRYLRTRLNAAKYWNVWQRLHLLAQRRGRLYPQLRETAAPGIDPVRLTDRFFLGSPQIRGFDIRGVGPRVQRAPYLFDHGRRRRRSPTSAWPTIRSTITDDALGGRAYYLAAPSSKSRSARACASSACGRRSSSTSARSVERPHARSLLDIEPGQRARLQPVHRSSTTSAVTRRPRQPASAATGETTDPLRHRAVPRDASSAIRRARAFRSASASTGTRRSARSASTSPTRCSAEQGDDTKLFTFNVGTAF